MDLSMLPLAIQKFNARKWMSAEKKEGFHSSSLLCPGKESGAGNQTTVYTDTVSSLISNTFKALTQSYLIAFPNQALFDAAQRNPQS